MDKKYFDDFIENEKTITISEDKILEFLSKTGKTGIPKAERIIKLALFLEWENVVKGWNDLKLLYDFALNEAPNNEKVIYYIDWIVSALKWQDDSFTTSFVKRVEITNDCYSKLVEAYSLAPNNPSINHLFGVFYYEHPKRDFNTIMYCEKALHHFKIAFASDSEKYISCLFIAHCYHDLKNWEMAYTYYHKVDRKKMILKNPEWTWRIWKLEEQMALCCAQLGRIAEAKNRLDTFITKVILLDDDQFTDLIANIDEAIETTLLIEDKSLKDKVFDLIVDKGYEKRYQKELELLSVVR